MNDITAVKKDEVVKYSQPYLTHILKLLGVLPKLAVFFGIATDGLPVLLNTQDKQSPNVIVWDKKARQSLHVLKCVSEYMFNHQTEVEFVVLTVRPKDYGKLNDFGMGTNSKTPCIGIIPFFSELADVVVRGLSRWIYENHVSAKRPVVLMIDGLEHVNQASQDFRDHFRRILELGRKKHVFVIGTSTRNRFREVRDWLDGFQREMYGRDIPWEFEYMDSQKNVVVFLSPRTENI